MKWAGPTGTTGVAGSQGPQGPAGLIGWQRIAGTATASNGTSPKTATASCSAGKVAVGGGHILTGNQPERRPVVASYASADNTWTITATNYSGTGSWALQAFVVCVNQP